MEEGIPIPRLTPEDARVAQGVLLEQERLLRYGRFGADEAFELGRVARSLVPAFASGYSVTITRERDGVRLFQWVADDKDERNLLFADGKRHSALEAGHAGPWAQLEAAVTGELDVVWDNVPARVPACGAFPIRVGDEWVATIAVSGLDAGLDHEVILRALERALGVAAPRWEAPVA
ncbi:MAG: heme-binding protein [Coriobacteriales bacterium]|nr:heme-binding protein [Coriobacteriales bacterium]